MTAFEKEVKRWFDFLTALVCIIIFSPLYLICYIAIKRDNDGPVIYKQIRIGRFGRPFYIYKFRSMVVDAEKNGEPQLWDAKSDNRLTKTGKFLRDHHLDELPQFWNVLIGDMSFVGPRPERKFYINQIMQHDPRYECLPDSSGHYVDGNHLQRLYRHHGEDAEASGDGLGISGTPLMVARHQNYLPHLRQHCLRKEILNLAFFHPQRS